LCGVKVVKNKLIFLGVLLSVSMPVFADDAADNEAAELAKKLANPVASLISIPIEFNTDADIGRSENGEIKSIKFTPVLPFEVNDDWNLITRTVFSYMDMDLPDSGIDETGLSDIVLSLYFSPKKPTNSGLIWGVGPVLLLNSATEDALGAGRWGVGPGAVVLKQTGPWTIGGLTSYLTDVGGDSDRDDVESLFFQPFASYNLPNGRTSLTLSSEITRDLEHYDTNAFATFTVNQMFKVGSQMMQGRIGVKHWYESADFGPDSTELNLRLTFLFPK